MWQRVLRTISQSDCIWESWTVAMCMTADLQSAECQVSETCMGGEAAACGCPQYPAPQYCLNHHHRPFSALLHLPELHRLPSTRALSLQRCCVCPQLPAMQHVPQLWGLPLASSATGRAFTSRLALSFLRCSACLSLQQVPSASCTAAFASTSGLALSFQRCRACLHFMAYPQLLVLQRLPFTSAITLTLLAAFA